MKYMSLVKRYKKMSINEALETAKRRLTALGTRLKSYPREAKAKVMNGLFSKRTSVFTGNHSKNRLNPPRAKT